MKNRKLLQFLGALTCLVSSAFAQTQTTEATTATVAHLTGSATITLPDGSTVAAAEGMKIPQGATIKTGADGDLYLESHKGYVTSIKKDSEVGVEDLSVVSEGGKVTAEVTTLNLKSGNLVAKLDPSKKAVNHYAVRTPKGVAAARGTVFTMQYNGQAVTIAVVNGTVSVVAPGLFSSGPSAFNNIFGVSGANTSSSAQGGLGINAQGQIAITPVTVSAGQAFNNDQANFNSSLGTQNSLVVGLSNIINDPKSSLAEANSIQELMALAVATVAVAAQNGIGGTTAAEAQQVAAAVFAAVPSAAAQAAALMKTSGVTSPAVTNAVSSQVPASQQAAFNTSLQTGTFTQTTGTTGTTSGTGVFTRTTTTTATQTTTSVQPIDPSSVSRPD